MSLVSNLFLLFVMASVLVYYIVPRKFQWIVLLIFSYIYYIAGGPRYVVFILFPILTEIFRVFHIFTEISHIQKTGTESLFSQISVPDIS